MNQISEVVANRLMERGIDPETAVAYGVYSMMHGSTGEVVVFPFLEHGQAVHEKFRARGKRFWQRKDGKKRNQTPISFPCQFFPDCTHLDHSWKKGIICAD